MHSILYQGGIMSTRALARITTLSLFAVALTLLIALSSGTAHAAGSFNPSSTICLDDQTTVDPNPLVPGHAGECDGSNAPGANDALTAIFGIVAPDYNFGFNVSFTPPEWGVAKGTDIPIGASVGTLNSKATLGLLGNPCKSPIVVDFEFVNASTDPGDPIDPLAPGEDDRLKPLAQDSNGNNIPDGADKWPRYLSEIDALKNVKTSQIRARMFGVNATAVVDLTIVLNFVIYEPGADLSDWDGKVLDIDPRLGYISVVVLQDPSAAASSDDPVNDFCSPLLSGNTAYGVTEDNPNTGTGGGFPYRTNPSDGAYSYIAASQPQRDADGDGIENALDPCPLSRDDQYGPNKDIAWDPRTQSPTGYLQYSDDDGDGLPNSCDRFESGAECENNKDDDFDGRPNDGCPKVGDAEGEPAGVLVHWTLAGPDCEDAEDDDGDGFVNDGCPKVGDPDVRSPTVGSIYDEDRDQWMNRMDNCPLVPNGPQQKNIPGVGNNEDEDSDGIGDACDPHPNDADAEGDPEALSVCVVHVLEIGAGGTPPIAAGTYQPCTLEGLGAMLSGGGDGGTTSDGGDAKKALLESLAVGMNITAGLESVPVGGSTQVVAACAEMENSLQPVSGMDITFKIDSQPGSDADLDGQAEVTQTSDAEGFAEATLNVGSTAGEIVVSATGEGCGPAETVTVTVTGEALGETTGPDGGAATGVGSLAPAVSSIPAWAAIASGLGGAGLLASLGAFLARFVRRRRY